MLFKRFGAFLTMGLLVHMIGSCGGSEPAVGLELQQVAPTGRLVARVSSAEGVFVDATVTVDGKPFGKPDGAGALDLELATGRHNLKITAPGLMDWENDLPVVGQSWQHEISMAPLTSTLLMAGKATTLQVGPAALLFPAGAYPTDMPLQAALVDGMSSARPGSPMFTDTSGDTRLVVYALHVRSPVQPSAAVTLDVPIPPGTPPDSLRLYPLDDAGEPTEPQAPTQVVNGRAVFAIAHFSDQVITKKATGTVAVITSLSGLVETQTPPDTTWRSAKKGQELTEGMRVRTQNGSRASLSYPSQTNLLLTADSSLVITADPTGLAWVDFNSRRAFTVFSRKLLKLQSRLERTRKYTPSAICGVRGSIASWDSTPIADEPGFETVDFRIYEGEGVCTLPSGEEIVIPQGQAASGTLSVGAADATAPGTTDAGSSGSCGTIPCAAVCTHLEQKVKSTVQCPSASPVQEFDTARCLSQCECVNKDCPVIFACEMNISCPECHQKISCDQQGTLDRCKWQPGINCLPR